jgi:hypothetical protein
LIDEHIVKDSHILKLNILGCDIQQRILDVIIQSLLEVLLLIAIMSDVSRGVAGKLKEAVRVLRHRHRSLK